MYSHTKSLIRFAALAGIIVPPTALAAVMLQFPADAIAGLGFDILVSGARNNGTVAVQMETPDGGTVGLRGTADENGDAILTVKGSSTQRAGSYEFEAEGESAGGLEVLPDAIDPVLSTIDVWTPRIEDDGEDAASVTVTLRDQFGNPLEGRIATLVSGRGDDEVDAETNQTDHNGEQHFTVRSYERGTISLRAIDLLSGIPLVDSATVRSGDDIAMGGPEDEEDIPPSRMANGNRFYYAQVAGFDVIDAFEIDAPSTLALGVEAPKITISAVDKDGNVIEDYVGSVVFSSTDPDATLPNFGKYTFKERDLGKKEFPLVLKFKESGEQTFRVEDQNDRTIFGDVTVDVTGDDNSPSGGMLAITEPTDGSTVNGSSVVIRGTGPKFTNVVIVGGAQDTPGSTDANGQFAITVALRTDQRDYLIRAEDEDGGNDSEPVLLRLDADAPTIGDITFNPPQPEENEKVLVVMKSEPNLKSAILTITQRDTNAVQEITLLPAASSGTYQAFFTAPQPDEYQPKLLATDQAGNTAELRTTLTVGSPALPVVEDVEAEPRVNGVNVSWTEVEGDEPVDQYRVYVGEKATSFDYFLDTEKPTGNATVAGLSPSKQYYFAVTALQGDRESDKSDVVSATPEGMTLTIVPEDQGLRLQWTAVDADAPLSHFLLEYGLTETQLTETRLLNRELTEYALRDLLNGVQYFLRLTPVTSAGKKLTDLSAISRGTPSGEGFHPGAGDPIPFDINNPPGGIKDHPPETPGSGLPAVLGGSALAALGGGAWYQLRRRAERKRVNAFLASLPSIN